MNKFFSKYLNIIERRGVKAKIIASLCSVLIIPFVFMIIYSVNANRIVEEQNLQIQTTLLQQIQSGFDSRLKDIEELGTQLAYNNQIKAFFQKQQVDKSDLYEIHLIRDLLEDYRLLNEYINDICVYNSNIDKIVTTQGYYSTELYYDSYINNKNSLSYDAWIQSLRDVDSVNFSIQNIREDDKNITTMRYNIIYPLDISRSYIGSIMILVDDSNLRGIMQDLRSIDESQLFIVDSDGNTMYGSEKNVDANQISELILNNDNSVIYAKINDIKYVILKAPSMLYSHQYVFAIPYSFFSKTSYLKMAELILFALLLIISASLVLKLANRQYKPMAKLIKEIQSNNINIENNDEYEIISNSLKKVVNDKNLMESKIKKIDMEKKYNLLRSIIKGEKSDFISIDDYCDAYNLRFEYDNFATIIFEPQNLGVLSETGDFEVDVETLELQSLIYRNIVEEMINEKYIGYVVNMGNCFVCVVNFENNNDDQLNEFIKIATKAKEFIKDHFHIVSLTAISKIHQGLHSIDQAYNECQDVLGYLRVNDLDIVESYSNISHIINYNRVFVYSTAQENAFTNQLTNEDFDHAIQTFKDMIKEAEERKILMRQTEQYVIMLFCNMILYAIDKAKLVSANERLSIMETIVKKDNLYDLETCVCDIIKQIQKQKSSVVNNEKYELSNKIKEYINNNYSDHNLNVAKVAEEFDINFKLISGFFKKYTGQGVLEYIHETRIKQAKKLLETTDMKIQDIAEKIGYYESNSFIRVFRMQEGIYPGKYREAYKRANNK